jgi:hypothetical protein
MSCVDSFLRLKTNQKPILTCSFDNAQITNKYLIHKIIYLNIILLMVFFRDIRPRSCPNLFGISTSYIISRDLLTEIIISIHDSSCKQTGLNYMKNLVTFIWD